MSMQCATKSLMASRDFKKADFAARALAWVGIFSIYSVTGVALCNDKIWDRIFRKILKFLWALTFFTLIKNTIWSLGSPIELKKRLNRWQDLFAYETRRGTNFQLDNYSL